MEKVVQIEKRVSEMGSRLLRFFPLKLGRQLANRLVTHKFTYLFRIYNLEHFTKKFTYVPTLLDCWLKVESLFNQWGAIYLLTCI